MNGLAASERSPNRFDDGCFYSLDIDGIGADDDEPRVSA
jgi:hypothetical protein